jgi:hypothetical protein
VKHDPKQVAAARELRDRYLEHVNADASALLTETKYDVSRRIERSRWQPFVRPRSNDKLILTNDNYPINLKPWQKQKRHP